MIKIKFKYRKTTLWLESDDSQWIVHEGFTKSVLKNEKVIYTRKNPAYLTSLESAINFIRELHLRKSDARSLAKLGKNIREIKAINKKEIAELYGKTNKTKIN